MSDTQTRLLVIDGETTGVAFNSDFSSYNPVTGEEYQSVSWGMIVVDVATLKPIDQLYIEIQWDGKSIWSESAERIHGLSKEYLANNGLTNEEAVEAIGNLIIKHWGPNTPVYVAGQNPHFDLCFLKRLMRSEGIDIRFCHRRIDTNSIGFAVYGTNSSDELFEAIGLPKRVEHNALDDALCALKVLQVTRKIADTCFG